MGALSWSFGARRIAHGMAAVLLLPALAFAQTQNLNLAWDPNPEPDIASYYVHVGTSPGNYNIAVQQVPASQTTYAFPATPGVKYYFAVKAVNEAGLWSPPSTEIVGGVPTFAQPANQTSIIGTLISALSLNVVDPDGGTLQFSATGLPPGLSINAATGVITGIPLSLGTRTVTVFAFDGTVTVQRSFTWSILDALLPPTVSAVSASPSSGSGGAQTFTLTYSDSHGALDLETAAVRFNTSSSAGPDGCALSYDRSSGVISLLNDAGTSWLAASFGAGTLQNGQCAVALGSSSAQVSGDTLTLRLAMSFSESYAGTKSIFMYAESAGGANSGWRDRGDWTVPSPAPATAPAAPADASGMIARWQFDEPSGAAAFDGIGGHDGTLMNGAARQADRGGSVVSFDGVNDYVALPNFDVSGSALTITAWVKSRSFANEDQRFISKSTNTAEQSHYWMLSHTNNGANRLRFRLRAGGSTTTLIASSGNLPLNTWYHVAATYDGATMRLFLNGTQVGSVAKSGALDTNSSVPVAIGRSPNGSNYLQGAIDDVRIYNRALSAAEIAALLPKVNLTADLASPRQTGTSVTFTATASGVGASAEYKWWVFNGTSWSVARNWSTNATFTWTPAGAGTYRVGVWVRSAGASADAPETNAGLDYVITSPAQPPLDVTGVSASLASPRPAGTSITFTANVSGGTAPYQYKWWIFNGVYWSVVQNWSAAASITWTPSAAGTYRVGVWVRGAGATADAPQDNAGIDYVITASGAPLQVTGVAVDKPSPRPAGTSLVFTAAVTGGTAPYQYKWWLFDGRAWIVLRDWTSNASIAWTPASGGTYRIGVWVRSAGRTADAPESNAGIDYVVTAASPVQVLGVTPSVTNPALWTTVSFAANVTGGTGPYQYKWWLFDGYQWVVLADWSAASSVAWMPTRQGTYRVGVWVRSAGVTVDAPQSNAGVNVSAH